MYQQLRADTQRAVDEAVQEQLSKIEQDRTLTRAGKDAEKKLYLEETAPALIENMLMGGVAVDRLCERIEGEKLAKKNPSHER
jgi:hypothetical protein